MPMPLLVRQTLAKYGDETFEAVAHRLRAARFVANISKAEISRSSWYAPDLQHIEAAEAGRVMPNYALLSFYWRRLRLNDEFFERGVVDHVPADIEDLLFAALKPSRRK
ncbi:MAG: hypothetical protein CSA68_07315 [Rhodobacterales bacterium]|nr:MAG: hypothetical protein CSA68_07315 [Rhodobacterales bacterium]